MSATSPRERIVRFGARQTLAGILTTPRDIRPGTPYFVLVNAGVVHRVGSNRLYVDIARAMAERGYPVLRFDLSGLGDSDDVHAGASLAEAALMDITAAFDFLQQTRQACSFVIGGLCSGANSSILTAFSDDRVTAVLLIDPSVPRTRRSVLLHHLRRLRHPATWMKVLALEHPLLGRVFGRLRGFAGVSDDVRNRSQLEELPVEEPSPAETRRGLQQLIDRGVQLMIVFTGGINQQYNYRNQLFDLLPGFDFRDQLRLEFMLETDHTISDRASRTMLLQSLGDWMSDCFPVATRSRASG